MRQSIFAILSCAALFATAAQASVEISTAATKNMSCSNGVCSPTDKKAVLNVNGLTNMLASGDVKITTGNGAITITIAAPFSWTSTSRLTLDANYNVSFRAAVTVVGQGAVTITTNDGGSGGDLLFFPGAKLDFWDTGSNLIINGGTFTLINDVHSLAADISVNPNGYYALAKDYDAGPDGKYRGSPIETVFSGKFIGLNHVIDNLRVIGGYAYLHSVGLFSECESTCTLDHLQLVRAHINVRSTNYRVGIVAGINLGTIVHTSSSGSVEAGDRHHHRPRYLHVGGLVGRNKGIIRLSSSSAKVEAIGVGSDGGGLVGYNTGRISVSFATGPILVYGASGVWAEGGGVAGRNEGAIEQSYATNDVDAPDDESMVGGLVGLARSSTVDQAYSVGNVAGGKWRGGSVGYDSNSLPSVFTSMYWDIETSGQTQGCGYGNCTGVTGLSDAQLKSGLPAGFDPAIWGQSPSINNGYPYLLANPPPR